jgi:hypothetical protein
MNRSTQTFVVTSITRAAIADELNAQLDYVRDVDGEDLHEFKDDDARLTDEVCQAYAAFIGNLDPFDLSEDAYEEVLNDYQAELIECLIGR